MQNASRTLRPRGVCFSDIYFSEIYLTVSFFLLMRYISFRVLIKLFFAFERIEVIRLSVILRSGLGGFIGHCHATDRVFKGVSHNCLLSLPV